MASFTAVWKLDSELAGTLGFLYVALGGSRAFKKANATAVKQPDWNFLAIMQTRDDIIEVFQHKATPLHSLFGIVGVETPSDELPTADESPEDWEVARIVGMADDGSQRSITISSYDHLLRIASQGSVRQFGVISNESGRHIRRHHPRDGHRYFTYPRLTLAEELYILQDADFLSLQNEPTFVNVGVTCDLFLTSLALYEPTPVTMSTLKQAMLCKWRRMSKQSLVEDLMPLLYQFQDFDPEFAQHLLDKFIRLSFGIMKDPAAALPMKATQKQTGKAIESETRCTVIPILPINWEVSTPLGGPLPPSPFKSSSPYNKQFLVDSNHVEPKYEPHPFANNSTGQYGVICLRGGKQWQHVFIKKSQYIMDEFAALAQIKQYFPTECILKLVVVDQATDSLFYKRILGKTLQEVRLDFYKGGNFLNNQEPMKRIDGFVAIEIRRAEHVAAAYRQTLKMNPTFANCATQHIHRFYHARLANDSRFLEFYGQNCLQTLGLPDVPEMTTAEFLSRPLIINGITHPPLRHYLIHATHKLSPHTPNGVRTLPTAFGLGDGHAGNVMTTPTPKAQILLTYLDYEVAGVHCPFLDIAKSIYNDGFTVLYADLLCDDAQDALNKSGCLVTWSVNAQGVRIDYNVEVDMIGKAVALVKFEHLLRPLLELVGKDDPQKVKLAEDVLACALFTCALLSRNFAKRPDLLFLNLAVGVRLVQDLGDVLAEMYGWILHPIPYGPSGIVAEY